MKNLILACFLFCAYVSNSQIINFPDENFKYALTKTICANTTIDFTRWDKNADLNNDGEIDEQEALSITGLYFSGGSFSNMEGIKYFKNLQFLYCTGYSLYNMDVSELKELRFLNLSGNQISILNVSNLTNLEELKCGYNRLKSLDVIGLTKLKVLYCEYNSELSELTFNNNPFLTELYSYSCKIKSLNLSNMKHLKYVISYSNKLDEVNLHNSDSIYYLSLSSNSLTNLDLTSKSNLVYLSCSYNKLSNLELDGLTAGCIHGDVRQTARAKVMRKFKSGEIRVLVATDIAARGIDIDNLPHVINFELPNIAEDYVHRIGRTGRAGNAGIALTLLSVKDYKMMIEIEKELIINIPRTEVEGFEATEKKPRLFKARPKQLSVKMAEARKVAKKTGYAKTNAPEKKPAKKRKITKRDDNRSFGKK